MSPEMRAALVTFALMTLGGTLDGAWSAVDAAINEQGDPVDEATLRRVMDALVEQVSDPLIVG